MAKKDENLIERRRYIRLSTPVKIAYTIPAVNRLGTATAKNISADGLRFETREKDLKINDITELRLDVIGASNPVHARGKIVWKKKLSLEDDAPFDVGIALTEIEDDNKNTFLKFLCDLLYSFPKESEYAIKKK